MSSKRVSVAGAARAAKAEDKKLRQQLDKAKQGFDSYQNFMMKMGIGTDNPTTFSSYGFNPVTKIRTLLEWIHRGSWLGGVAVDLVADDMTRGGVDVRGELEPDQIDTVKRKVTELKIWDKVNEWIKWARLYGGAIAVKLIDGQRMEDPLNPDRISTGQFKGLAILDRWLIEPSLNNLVQEPGPYLGLPKYYRVVAMSPYLAGMNIHYTRVFRMEGIKLPFQQRLQENLWGLSILERIYDRMIAFDSATTGAAQLVFRSYIRTYKIAGLREAISSNQPVAAVLTKYLDMMRRFQGIEGVTVIDGEDDFVQHSHSSFSGLRDALMVFDEQLAGALQVPLVRLFGQSPAGLNSSGESDLKTYYDNVRRQQENDLQTPMDETYKLVALSEGIQPDKSFGVAFRHLGQLGEKDKSDMATIITQAVVSATEAGIIQPHVAAKELKQASEQTGVFSNISDEDIEELKMNPPPEAGEEGDQTDNPDSSSGGPASQAGPEEGDKDRPAHDAAKFTKEEVKYTDNGKGNDKCCNCHNFQGSLCAVVQGSIVPGGWCNQFSKDIIIHDHPHFQTPLCVALRKHHSLDAIIETPKGTRREGTWGEHILPADYGFLRGTVGADGDELDCFIGPEPESPTVFIVDQRHLRGGFDEHKVMLGYHTKESALADFRDAYRDNADRRVIAVSECTMPQFKQWLAHGDMHMPFAGSVQ